MKLLTVVYTPIVLFVLFCIAYTHTQYVIQDVDTNYADGTLGTSVSTINDIQSICNALPSLATLRTRMHICAYDKQLSHVDDDAVLSLMYGLHVCFDYIYC
jgi:hypothetical protein